MNGPQLLLRPCENCRNCSDHLMSKATQLSSVRLRVFRVLAVRRNHQRAPNNAGSKMRYQSPSLIL